MTNKLKGMTRQVRLTVQCWWLNRDVDRLARRIYKGVAWQVTNESEVQFRRHA